jgi:hypothetical protein
VFLSTGSAAWDLVLRLAIAAALVVAIVLAIRNFPRR